MNNDGLLHNLINVLNADLPVDQNSPTATNHENEPSVNPHHQFDPHHPHGIVIGNPTELTNNWNQQISRQTFQALEAEKQRELTQAIEKFKAELQIAIQADNIAFQKWKTETDQEFAIEIRYLDAQIARQRDKQNRDDAIRDAIVRFFPLLMTSYKQSTSFTHYMEVLHCIHVGMVKDV